MLKYHHNLKLRKLANDFLTANPYDVYPSYLEDTSNNPEKAKQLQLQFKGSFHPLQRAYDSSLAFLGKLRGKGQAYPYVDPNSLKDQKDINLVFTGAWDGTQHGPLGFFRPPAKVSGGFKPRKNVVPFRFNDIKKAQAWLKALNKLNKKFNINVTGHSYGAMPAATVSNDLAPFFPNLSFKKLNLVDPVGRTAIDTRNVPNKVNFYYPRNRGYSNGDQIARVGGVYMPRLDSNPKSIINYVPNSTHVNITRRVPVAYDLFEKDMGLLDRLIK